MKKKNFIFYIILYTSISSISLFGLSLNIKTIELSKQLQAINKEIKSNKENNQSLRFSVAQETTLDNIHKKAKKFKLKKLSKQKIYHIKYPQTKK